MKRKRNYILGSIVVGDVITTLWLSQTSDKQSKTVKAEKPKTKWKTRWTKEENDELIHLASKGIPPREIAIVLKRNTIAVSSRLSELRKKGQKIPHLKDFKE